MPNELIQARLANVTFSVADIDKKAADLGMNRSELILKAVDMLMNFDEVFFNRIQKRSNDFNIPEWVVMQNMIIKSMAKDAARAIVWGPETRMLDEFMIRNDGVEARAITGEELFNTLRDKYIRDEEKKLLKLAIREDSHGLHLDEKEVAVLIKYRRGKTWLESDEYKELQREQAEHERIMKEYGISEKTEIDEDEIVTDEELAGWQAEEE